MNKMDDTAPLIQKLAVTEERYVQVHRIMNKSSAVPPKNHVASYHQSSVVIISENKNSLHPD
jgi:hypothetical protein